EPGIETCTLSTRRATDGAARLPGAGSLRLTETDRAIIIGTGSAAFHLNRMAFPLLDQVRVGERQVLDASSTRVEFTDEAGRCLASAVEETVVEACGPVRATVRVAGCFPGRAGWRFAARCCFFAGTGLVRIRFTLHNPRRAQHSGGLWDLGDPGSILFRDLSL